MAFMRVYRSYEEFERDELRRVDSLQSTVDDMLDEMFSEELDFEPGAKRGRKTVDDLD
jgi:hypothetical protein